MKYVLYLMLSIAWLASFAASMLLICDIFLVGNIVLIKRYTLLAIIFLSSIIISLCTYKIMQGQNRRQKELYQSIYHAILISLILAGLAYFNFLKGK